MGGGVIEEDYAHYMEDIKVWVLEVNKLECRAKGFEGGQVLEAFKECEVK